ncbi:MAG: hypothetical protein R3B13_33565 [Polyangiaceae bacterium]
MAHLLRQSHVLVGATLVVAACADPLDLFGVEEVVTNRSQAQKPPAIADDKIEDKHPVYDPALVITETFDSCEVTLNKSASVTKLDVLPWGKGDGALNKIFPTRTAALEALGDRPVMPSMEIINGALKPFDDGLYAAVELAAESGADGALIDKAALLRDLLAELVTRASGGAAAEQPLARVAATQLGAAMLAGGESPTLPSGVEGDAQALLAVFNTDLRSRPIGFYTWTPELASIFRRDRLLQSPDSVRPDFGAFAETALILNQVPAIAVRYTAALDLYAGLTNPYFNLPPTALMPLVPDSSALANLSAIKGQFSSQHPETQGSASCAAHLAFLPASDSPETKLFRDLYCDKEIPGDQNLIDILIDRIRSGAVDLTPSATSGWYDRQLYALETLLVPESAPEKDHLFLTKRYKEKLIETFKSLITQHRETHVKQLDLGSSDDEGAGAPVLVDVYPKLPIEPFPTFYLRTARAYRFLQGILRASMGQAFLDQSARVLEGGSRSQVKLGDELEDKITLCYGLYAVAARSIGMRPEVEAAEVDLDAAETAARSWLTNWRNDTDIARDPRVIVPVEHDKVRHTVRYWAILGVKPLRIQAQFYPKFEPKILSAGYCQFRSFVDTRPYTLVEQQVELSLAEDSPPPTRDEFRAIADQHDNVADIVAALESR